MLRAYSHSIREKEEEKGDVQSRKYEKPFIRKEETMNFPLEMINSSGDKVVCRQCSGCHGCR